MGNLSPYHMGSRRDVLQRFKASDSSSTSLLKTSSNKVIALPEGMEAVHAKLFFQNSTLQRIKIPSSVERIRFCAFEGCQTLVTVDLAVGLRHIEINAFAKCTSLQEIHIPSTVDTIGIAAFSNCTSLVIVDLVEGLKKICSMAFSQCTSLVTIAVPTSVYILKPRAFEKCSSLVEAYLPNTLKIVEEGLFASCSKLERIKIPSSVKLIRREAFVGCTSLVQVDLPEGLQKIEAMAFWKCLLLKEIGFSHRVGTIEFLAFSECNRLTEVSLPMDLKVVKTECFRDCTLLEKVHFPSSSVTQIMEGAFMGCTSLVEINLSEGLRSLEAYAFSTCLSLVAIRIPSTVERIAYQAFFNCRSLTSVEISAESKVEINDGAFMHCQSLVNICVPELSKMESWKFIGCPFLQQQCNGWLLGRVVPTRLDGYTVHAKCYHASETTVDELRGAAISWEHENLVDSFGMTPFHVLLASAKARMDILQVLLEKYPAQVLDWKDDYGKRAEDYLSDVWMDGSRAMMKLVLQKRLLDRLTLWGSDPWRVQMEHQIHRLLDSDEKASRNKHLRSVNMLMKRYQQIETVALLELWLWNQKIETEDGPVDRARCRANCGFSFIQPMVFEFLT